MSNKELSVLRILLLSFLSSFQVFKSLFECLGLNLATKTGEQVLAKGFIYLH
jgi:hypothetical protein